MKVSILVLSDSTPISPVGAMEVLRKAGQMHSQLGKSKKPFFDVELVGVKSKRVRTMNKLVIDCEKTIDEVRSTDLLLIPAMEFDIPEKLKINQSVIRHIVRLKKNGAEVGTMCTGAFLLASTGLLDGKSATTHWYKAPLFTEMFPKVTLEDDRIIVDAGGIYTSGGATSSLNLCLYLVEKYCGRETAIFSAKMLLMDPNHAFQSSYAMFKPQSVHKDDAIAEAQKAIETSKQRLTVELLADKVNLSKRSFIRRFKASTGNTPIEYIQRVNVEKVKRRLEESNDSIGSIIYSIGYNDINSFRKLFVKYASLSPVEYRRRYGSNLGHP
ncbi:MAG: helix-turn-helix domain-containing protein [Bacteroidota bacterium]